MAEIDVKFQSKALQRLVGLISRRSKEIEKSKQFATMISPIVFADIQDHFKKEMGPDGKWKALNPRYAKWKKKKGRSTKILQFTGRLKQNFLPSNFRLASKGYEWFNPTSYAKKHDEGLDGMPKRSFMWLSDKGAGLVSKAALSFILGK